MTYAELQQKITVLSAKRDRSLGAFEQAQARVQELRTQLLDLGVDPDQVAAVVTQRQQALRERQNELNQLIADLDRRLSAL